MARKGWQATFPLSRIKKLMQKDEDVGKVAVATPILVSRSIELFLESLLKSAIIELEALHPSKTNTTTKQEGSADQQEIPTGQPSRHGMRKLSLYHFKLAINKNEQFDFLRDLVRGVPDEEPSSGAGQNGDSTQHTGKTNEKKRSSAAPSRTASPMRKTIVDGKEATAKQTKDTATSAGKQVAKRSESPPLNVLDDGDEGADRHFVRRTDTKAVIQGMGVSMDWLDGLR